MANDAWDGGVRYPVPCVRIWRLPVVDVVVLHHNEAVPFRCPLGQEEVRVVLFFRHRAQGKIIPEDLHHTNVNYTRLILVR